MIELTKEELSKADLDIREKNDKILHYICFGIISMCHYFIISSGYLLYFIPLILSLLSIGADWYSNWSFYNFVEKHYDGDGDIEQWDTDILINITFAFAILTYLVLLTNTFLINLF